MAVLGDQRQGQGAKGHDKGKGIIFANWGSKGYPTTQCPKVNGPMVRKAMARMWQQGPHLFPLPAGAKAYEGGQHPLQ